uniref:AI-2E family transporter n=1 Tax=Sphingomonas adhaesiva TaxID=28212 RepID=UPI0035C675DF
MPVDVRNLSLALLALFASVALLHWASAVFIPIMLSLLLTTALRPLVEVLYRYHVPRWLSAGALLISLVLGLASAAWSLSDGATQLVDSLPVAAKKVRDNLKARAGGSSPLAPVTGLLGSVGGAAGGSTGGSNPLAPVTGLLTTVTSGLTGATSGAASGGTTASPLAP